MDEIVKTRILIYRTDRIGDLLYSCPLILAIKKNFPNSHITLIASNKNYLYAKDTEIFDDSTINKNLETEKEPEMFDNSDSEEDFEIPAFLRKQKD